MELENIRKLIDLLAVNQENLQKVINLDIQAITRGINIHIIKNKFQKKGYHIIAAEIGVPRNYLREWVQQFKYINETNSGGKKYRLEGAGRNPSTLKIEDKLLCWLNEQRRFEIAITTNEIITKLIELEPNKKENSYHSFQLWCYRFLKRNPYGIRIITHIGQKLKDTCKEEYHKFFLKLYIKWDSILVIKKIIPIYLTWTKHQSDSRWYLKLQ